MKETSLEQPQVFIEEANIPWEHAGPGVKRKIMAYDETCMMVRVEFEKDAIGPLHQHRHVQISSVESGAFEIEIDGKKNRLQKGDVFFVPSNLMHGAVCLEAGVLIDVFSPMREDFLG